MPAEGAVGMTETAPAVRQGQSLGDALKGHDNALGFIRLVLAIMVIFDHAFPLGGFGADPFAKITQGQASLGGLAVGGFFAISGYLIAKSGMSADVLQFFWRRVLRIFPAYWVVLLFAALVAGPIIWLCMNRNLGTYFTFAPLGPVHYFTSNWTLNIGSYALYDIFANTTPYGISIGHASALNGSIWTLIYEWTCYVLIGVMVAFGVLLRAKIVVPILTGLVFVLQVVYLVNPGIIGSIFPFFADYYRINLMLIFLYGSSLAVYSKKIPFDDRLGVLAGIVLLFTLHWGGYTLLGLPAGAYFIIYLGARIGGPLRKIGAKNDYSYGVYVYGFLVQQTLAYFGLYRWGYLPYVLVALVVSLGLAWLSWHAIEKHAMALKDWGPGRGWRHWYDRIRSLRARDSQTAAPVADD
jgi:peptidoglycan/LPS O-acetylase OafA/YrhL